MSCNAPKRGPEFCDQRDYDAEHVFSSYTNTQVGEASNTSWHPTFSKLTHGNDASLLWSAQGRPSIFILGPVLRNSQSVLKIHKLHAMLFALARHRVAVAAFRGTVGGGRPPRPQRLPMLAGHGSAQQVFLVIIANARRPNNNAASNTGSTNSN